MLKTSAQVAVNLCYGQRARLHLFSPLRGPRGLRGRGCANEHPEAAAPAAVCDTARGEKMLTSNSERASNTFSPLHVWQLVSQTHLRAF